ncbi:MAG: hypothetical protein ACK6EB_44405 [Planctomyces sp.]
MADIDAVINDGNYRALALSDCVGVCNCSVGIDVDTIHDGRGKMPLLWRDGFVRPLED